MAHSAKQIQNFFMITKKTGTFENLLNNTQTNPEENLAIMKTKLWPTCEKYHNAKSCFKYNQMSSNLWKSKYTAILKQGKCTRVVILEGSISMENCLYILTTAKFSEMHHDSTVYIERKVHNWKVSKINYHHLFPLKFTWVGQEFGTFIGLLNCINFQTVPE